MIGFVLDRHLAPTGLKISQFSLLGFIGAEGPVSIGRLSDLLSTDRTTLTRNLRPLLQDGLIELEMEPSLAAEAAGTAFAAMRAASPVELAGAPAGEREIEFLTRALTERIRVSGGIRLHAGRPTTVALVGPTGVGKTTTLAKLGALAKIQQGKKVGIISADSFRMGANGRQRAEEYTPEAMAAGVLDVYQRVLNIPHISATGRRPRRWTRAPGA